VLGLDDIGTDTMRGMLVTFTEMHGYTLTSSSVGDINPLVSGSLGSAVLTGITLYDPLAMFGDQVSGDKGFCLQVRGYWYRIQAPCKA
jgi:hypothetical protein